MANNDILGIQATINGADVNRGANEFIAQVSRMELYGIHDELKKISNNTRNI